MKTVGITGATGFVGGFIADYLERQGNRVIRFGRKEKENILHWDITEGPFVGDIHVDVVVHCAAAVDDWASYGESYKVNVLGTQNVLRSFPKKTAFIYISSASVYDPFCKKKVIDEMTCVGGHPLNAYSKTKLMGEREVVAAESIPSRVVLRPHIIYGPGDTIIGPRFKRATRSGVLIVPGNGNNLVSFTHVENLALAVERVLAVAPMGASVYNITDLEAVPLKNAFAAAKALNGLKFKEIYISRAVCFAIGRIWEAAYSFLDIKHAPLLTRYLVQQLTESHILDVSKAQKELGYRPSRSIDHDLIL